MTTRSTDLSKELDKDSAAACVQRAEFDKLMLDKRNLTQAYKTIVDFLRSNTKNKDLLANFEGTEDRAVRALLETCSSDHDIQQSIAKIVQRVFPVDVADKSHQGMVTQGPITINSHCPHHLMPVRFSATVSYLPKDGRVLGLSKLARLAKVLGNRPVLHEQLASDIADVLYEGTPIGRSYAKHDPETMFSGVGSAGSAVQLIGIHCCMACRGVESDAKTSVVELRGAFWEPDFESKFYQAINSIAQSKVFG